MTKKKRLLDEQIEHNLAQVDASFAIEVMPLTDEDKTLLRRFAKGELTIEDVKKIALDRVNREK